MARRPPQTVLVAGSYPPALSPAADATVSAARRELAAGRSIITVAPRSSGASRTLALGGPGTARRLDQLRRETGADGLVLSVEPGIPLLPEPPRSTLRPVWHILDIITLALLRPRLRRFGHVTLLVATGGPVEVATVRRLASPPRSPVDEIAVSGPAAEPAGMAALTAAAGAAVPVRVVDAPALGPPYPDISAAGPPEPAIVRARRHGARAGRRVLGPLYTPLRLLAWPLERIVPAARRRWHSVRGLS